MPCHCSVIVGSVPCRCTRPQAANTAQLQRHPSHNYQVTTLGKLFTHICASVTTLYFCIVFSISSILPVVTSRSTPHSTVLRGSCLFVILLYLYMSPSQRSVCDCDQRILCCVVQTRGGRVRESLHEEKHQHSYDAFKF